MATQGERLRHLERAPDGHIRAEENDITLKEIVTCELCEEPIPFDTTMCTHCKAGRKPCPFCGIPFWHGADICPHCLSHKPDPNSWSLE